MIAIARSARRRTATLAITLAAIGGGVLVGVGGCTGAQSGCITQNDCPDRQVCQSGSCVTPCWSDDDCTGAVDTCQNGTCAPTLNPTCTNDSDCTHPDTCQKAAGALCRGGSCRYKFQPAHAPCSTPNACAASEECDGSGQCVVTPIPCDQPPDNFCTPDDATYRSYNSPGTCDPRTGTCDYSFSDRACPGCATNCLRLCNGVSCVPLAGSCQGSGACVPTNPVTCAYTPAVDGTRCDLSGTAAGSNSGVCAQGNCVSCLTAAECKSPPAGPSVCFAAACTDNACSYTLTSATTSCSTPTCANGSITNTRTCGSDGSCPDKGSTSCPGDLACNADGSACLSKCAADNECVAGYFCRSDGSCAANCTAGYTRCGDGCVDNTTTSNCGSCGNVCPGTANGTATCVNGTCGFTCNTASGYFQCSDTATCGGGTCGLSCGSGYFTCNSQCTASSATNCGRCGNVCPIPANGYATCTAGACGIVCNYGFVNCNGSCTASSTSNCGTCNYSCPACGSGFTAQCASGQCGCVCESPKEACGDGRCALPGICSCFVAGTPISLADGSVIPIEDVTVDTEVLSYSPERGDFVAGRVTDLFVPPQTPRLLRINGVLTTTPEHRFYVGGQWLRAGELRVGDVLLGDGSPGIANASGAEQRIVSLEELPGGVTTYNFEVDEVHDYFAGGVLVHNIK